MFGFVGDPHGAARTHAEGVGYQRGFGRLDLGPKAQGNAFLAFERCEILETPLGLWAIAGHAK